MGERKRERDREQRGRREERRREERGKRHERKGEKIEREGEGREKGGEKEKENSSLMVEFSPRPIAIVQGRGQVNPALRPATLPW